MTRRRPRGQVVDVGGRGDTWSLRFHYQGVRHYVQTEARTRVEAELELENIWADIRRKLWTPPAKQGPVAVDDDPLFADYRIEWFDRQRPRLKSQRSIENLTWAIEKHLAPFFDSYRIKEIDIRDVDAFATAKLRARTLSNSSINRCVSILGAILDAAQEERIVTENVARGKKRKLPAGRPRRTWLEPHEVKALLAAAPVEGGHRAILSAMVYGGCRVDEAASLRWSALDLPTRTLHIADAKTAAGIRSIELNDHLRADLIAWREIAPDTSPRALMFTTRGGGKRTRNNIRANILHRAVAAANLQLEADGWAPMVTPTNHSLRRTHASLLFAAGESPAFVMSALGHTTASMSLEVYTKVIARQDRAGGSRIDDLLRNTPVRPSSAMEPANEAIDDELAELLEGT